MYCKDLCKKYNPGKANEIDALSDVSLEFNDCGLTFILGKSGSGKSTLLNLLATLDTPTSGGIYYGDERIDTLSQEKLDEFRNNNIGFVFQDYGLIRELSAAENILLGNINSDGDSEKVRRLLYMLDIADVYDKKVSELSGGQQQRVSIARALYRENSIIFADEPTGNLDKKNAAIIMEHLKNISEERLVVVVTHDQELAEKYGDRIIVIEDGRVKSDKSVKPLNSLSETAAAASSEEAGCNKKILKNIAGTFGRQKLFKKGSSVVLMVLALVLIGVMCSIYRFNFSAVSEKVLKEDPEMPSIGICRGYTNSISDEFCFGPRPIDEDMLQELSQKYPERKDYFYQLLGAKICNGDTGSEFLKSKVRAAVLSSSDNLSMYGFSLDMGKYPQTQKEVAVTDYLAYSVYLLAPEQLLGKFGLTSKSELSDTASVKKLIAGMSAEKKKALFGTASGTDDESVEMIKKNPGLLLLGEEFDFGIDTYTVSGIISTGYEKYSDMIYMSGSELDNDSRTAEFKQLANLYYNDFYVCKDFFSGLYQRGGITFDSGLSVKYSKVKEAVKMDKELHGSNIYMSASAFRTYMHEEFDESKVGTYKMKIESSVSYDKGGPVDVFFEGGDSDIVGIIDLPDNYLDVFGTDNIIVFSDEFYDEYSQKQIYCWMVQLDNNAEDFDNKALVGYLNSHGMYYYNSYAYDIYNLVSIMNIFRRIFLIALIVIIVFAVVMIVNYYSGIVSDKKREIGIMRALGIRSDIIRKIFLRISLKTMLCVSAASVVLFTVGLYFANSILSDAYLSHTLNEKVKKLSILNYDAFPYLFIILLSAVLLILAVSIPMRKISRISPVDAIKK